MRTAILALCGAVVGALGLIAWHQLDSPGPPTVTLGERYLRVVKFPDVWIATDRSTNPPAQRILNFPGGLQVRKPAESDELFFGVVAPEGDESDNHYALNLDGSFAVRSVDATEWRGARQVTPRRDHTLPDPQRHGKVFQATGQSLRGTIVSPDEKVMALLSLTETERPKNLGPLIVPLKGTYRGTNYLDLYETTSGEKLAAASIPYGGMAGGTLFADAAWIAERVFAIPLDLVAQTWLIAIVPAR